MKEQWKAARRAVVAGLLIATAGATVFAGAASATTATTSGYTVGASILQGSWAVVHARGAGGTHVSGNIDLTGRLHANVTCLSVSGNDAILTGRVDISNDSTQPVGSWIVVEAVDNGATGDEFRTSFSNNQGISRVSPRCYAPVYGPAPIDDGYVTVS